MIISGTRTLKNWTHTALANMGIHINWTRVQTLDLYDELSLRPPDSIPVSLRLLKYIHW